jgi:hypothetical protein
MLDLDSLLVSLYVLVDDWWKLKHSSEPPRAGRPALLTPTPTSSRWPSSPSSGPASQSSEISGALLRHICAPTLPEALLPKPTQPQGARARSLSLSLSLCVEPHLRHFQRAVARTLCDVSEVYLVSWTPHSHCGHREGKSFSQGGLFAGQATFGRSASKTEWVYGFSRWRFL